MPWCSGLRRQHDGAVVATEVGKLGVQFRIKPISLQHAGLEVVDDNRARHTAEVLQSVLEGPQEVIRRLREDGLAVASARVGEHDPQDVRLTAAAVGPDHRRSRAEVDLGFVSRWALHPPKRHRLDGSVLLEEASYAVVTDGDGSGMLGVQVLVDTLG